jgi:hypothetical protein
MSGKLKLLPVIALSASLIVVILSAIPVSAGVSLLYFRATGRFSDIYLEWETASEFENLGFNLFRGETGVFEDAIRLNDNLIPAGGGATGQFYDWVDANVVENITYTYWLQDLDLNGNKGDPVSAEASLAGGSGIATQPPSNNNTATPEPTNTPSPTASQTPAETSQPEATATTQPNVPTAESTAPSEFVSTATTAPVAQPTESPQDGAGNQIALSSTPAVFITNTPEPEVALDSRAGGVDDSTSVVPGEENVEAVAQAGQATAASAVDSNDDESLPQAIGQGISSQTEPEDDVSDSDIEGGSGGPSIMTIMLVLFIVIFVIGAAITAWLLIGRRGLG